jgi:hypothetical protein
LSNGQLKSDSREQLLHECTLPGETRADGFYPGHANAAQLTRNRFLIIYSTRGWRGTDDNTVITFTIAVEDLCRQCVKPVMEFLGYWFYVVKLVLVNSIPPCTRRR